MADSQSTEHTQNTSDNEDLNETGESASGNEESASTSTSRPSIETVNQVPAKERYPAKRSKPTHDIDTEILNAIRATNEVGDQFDSFGANVAARLRTLYDYNRRYASDAEFNIQGILHDYEVVAFPSPDE